MKLRYLVFLIVLILISGCISQIEGPSYEEALEVHELRDGRLTGRMIKVGDIKEGVEFDVGSLLEEADINEVLKRVCANDNLVAIRVAKFIENDCIYPKCMCYVCTNCGNGNCESKENVCNCPEDCS